MDLETSDEQEEYKHRGLLLDPNLLVVRYRHAGEIPTLSIGWYLKRVNERHRVLGFERGEAKWLIPLSEIAFLKLTAGLLAGFGFIVACVLMLRGLR